MGPACCFALALTLIWTFSELIHLLKATEYSSLLKYLFSDVLGSGVCKEMSGRHPTVNRGTRTNQI